MIEKMFWRGRDVEQMTRDELIEALKTQQRLHECHMQGMRTQSDFWFGVARTNIGATV